MDELIATIDRILRQAVEELRLSNLVPVRSGRLRSAIKVREAPYGFDVYIDTGNLSEEEWKEVSERLWGVAPYAARVNQVNPYWRRVAVFIHDKLRDEIGSFETTYAAR